MSREVERDGRRCLVSVVASVFVGTGCGRIGFEAVPGDARPSEPDAAPLVCTLYVNDTATAGDRYTTMPGDDGNPGTANAPFATLGRALTSAGLGDVICVDAGSYTGSIQIDKSVTIVGIRQGISACDRTGDESVIRGRVTVTETASAVTLDGLQLEREPAVTWRGVNLTFEASTFQLRNTKVIPSTPSGGFAFFGYVGLPTNVPMVTSFVLENNAFAELRNDNGTSAIAIANTTVSDVARISGNCFDNSGDGVIVVFGTYNALEVRSNVVVNSLANGAGGFGFDGLASKLTVADNSILDSPRNGIVLSMSADQGGLTGNIVRGSGTRAAGFANLQIGNITLAPGFVIRDNDFASPTAASSAITSTPSVVAECNWYGSETLAGVAPLISGSVDFSPFLTSGTDTASAPGFQPVASSCDGQ